MPFTFAHAAAVLPLRRRLIFSALIVGTFAPDFEYFLELTHDDTRFGHSVHGLVWLTFPSAVLVLWLFHTCARHGVVRLLPEPLRARLIGLPRFRFGGVSRFALILLCLVIGIATHIAWDSFTHGESWIYRHWALLRTIVMLPHLGPLPAYKVSWYLNSALGSAIMLAWMAVRYRATPPAAIPVDLSGRRKLATIAVILLLAVAGAIVRALIGIGVPYSPATVEDFAGQVVITFVAFIWWQLVVYGWWTAQARE